MLEDITRLVLLEHQVHSLQKHYRDLAMYCAVLESNYRILATIIDTQNVKLVKLDAYAKKLADLEAKLDSSVL
jgi:hypothetical protein